jgi:ABC-type antimicrobial peptide transport system permease subunit
MRLFRQHVIESGMLAVLGGSAGLGLGYLLAQVIHLLFQTGRDVSSAFDLDLDLRVLAYTGALSILTACFSASRRPCAPRAPNSVTPSRRRLGL